MNALTPFFSLSPIHNRLQKRDYMSKISAFVAGGFAGSGIDASPGHFLYTEPFESETGQEWITKDRCRMALYAVAASYLFNDNVAHNRRYGKNVTELVHVIGVAHIAYNNPQARKDLAAAGISSDMLATAAILHDIIEDTQKSLRLRGTVLDRETFFKDLCKALELESPIERAFLRATVFDYLTDRDDPDLSGLPRINEQEGKNPKPSATIDYIAELNLPQEQLKLFLTAVKSANVAIRAGDKFNNLARDCMSRDIYNAAKRENSAIQDLDIDAQREIGLPDADLKTAIDQAEAKIYPFRRYGVSHLGDAYGRLLGFLRHERIAVRENFVIAKRKLASTGEISGVPFLPGTNGIYVFPAAAEAPQVL